MLLAQPIEIGEGPEGFGSLAGYVQAQRPGVATLAATALGIFRSHITDMMWDTSIKAADAVLAHLAAGD
jgi:hypothetical protein